MIKTLRTLIVIVSLMAAQPTLAEEAQQADLWKFEIAPLYLWAINIDGDLGIRGRTTSASVDFGNIYDNLEGVFTARVRALYDDTIQLFLDYNYLDLGTEQTREPVTLGVSFESQFVNAGAGYRLTRGPHNIFLNGGIRYVKLESGVSLIGQGIELSGDEDWIDPIIGLDYSYSLSDKFGVRLLGDIGGFGVSSDFTWQAVAIFDYRILNNLALVAGYRAIGTDYESDNGYGKVTFDTIIHGPILGLDFRF